MKDISEAVTQDKLEVPYNPHMLVTYKAIAGTYAEPESPTYLTDKVTDIEWALHNMRADKDAYYKLRSKISGLEEQVVEWANPNYDKDEVIERLEGEIDYGLEDTGVDIEATGEESSSEFDVESPEGGEELKEYDVYGNEGFGYFDKDENPVDIDDVDFDFEPEGHVQSYDEFISKFDRRDHNDPHYDIKKRQHDSNIEKYGNLRLGKKRTPVSDVSSIDRIMDSIFAESKVEKTINKYLS